ncbi:MAG: hydrogenase maturation nickel metallochaperone HypA [Candidatus Promineifilaceae bacterium]|nr:hydrogenase maturation nickel metallochaperone HypA [Candidatus Promineifilaceae bacterium]
MHELMVTESILEVALRHADGAPITDIRLVIGDLSTVVDDSVQFYWDFVSEGTGADGAILHFRRIPAELQCLDCAKVYSPQEDLTCPVCRSTHIEIIRGKEFYLESIDVAREPLATAAPEKTGNGT